jgi:uncharacterized damage-inducible protein DinB
MFELDEFLDHFEKVRQRTRRVAACVPVDRVEWSYKAGAFSIGDLVRHIAVTERYLWAETVHGRPSAYAGHGPELADGRDAVLAFLDRLHGESMTRFRALTSEQLAGKCTTPGNTQMTTWKWLRMMIEHEIHHRGQIYSLLGMLDAPAPSLYGMTVAQVQATSGLRAED